ncbi:MAG: ROK family protein [Candidatus Aminicenantes bacterium]|nr:ROK family protein [Candidatus Aminicenantes bacterium]
MIQEKAVLGIDIGATKIGVGRIESGRIIKTYYGDITAQASESHILEEVIQSIDSIFDLNIQGIGVGVPSLVDVEKGIIYDVQNIPAWKKVHLKDILEERFNTPVYINNDANCFAVGEKYFGKGKEFRSLAGVTLGSGFGTGLIIDDHLYSGVNCGAGEFGSIPYLDKIYEYYCSGQFFLGEYGTKGEEIFNRAEQGEVEALGIFQKFGRHIGNAVKAILFAVDPEAVIFGGSVSRSFAHFQESMWESLFEFPYQHAIDRLKIMPTDQPQISILGAAALYYDARRAG